MRKTSHEVRRIARRSRKPSELLLVPMIDVFVVLVTFLLMTAVFSRTVILELNLPAQMAADYREPPQGLQLEVIVRPEYLQVADRGSGPLATMPNVEGKYDFPRLTEYLKTVKAKFPELTAATVLLEPETPYDIVVQVMDHVRVLELREGTKLVQAELFPDISIGDAPEKALPATATAPTAGGRR